MTTATDFLDSADREFDMPASLKEYVDAGLCALDDITPRKLYGAFSYAWEIAPIAPKGSLAPAAPVCLVFVAQGTPHAVWAMRHTQRKAYAIFPDGSTIGEEETEDLLNDLDYREEWLAAPEEDGGHDAGGWLNCDASNAEEKEELYMALRKMHKALVNQRRQYWALKLGVEPGLER